MDQTILDRLTSSFRFGALTEEQATRCTSLFQLESKPRKNVKGSGFCAPIEIKDESKNTMILKFMKAEKIDSRDCDLFISILTEFDTRIYDTPSYAVDLLKQTDCKLTISFTNVRTEE